MEGDIGPRKKAITISVTGNHSRRSILPDTNYLPISKKTVADT